MQKKTQNEDQKSMPAIDFGVWSIVLVGLYCGATNRFVQFSFFPSLSRLLMLHFFLSLLSFCIFVFIEHKHIQNSNVP